MGIVNVNFLVLLCQVSYKGLIFVYMGGIVEDEVIKSFVVVVGDIFVGFLWLVFKIVIGDCLESCQQDGKV